MEEDTPLPGAEPSPGSAGNDGVDGDSGDGTGAGTGGAGAERPLTEAPPAALWSRLGHRDEADLEMTYIRQRQQVQAAATETQRLQREIALRDGRLGEIERAAMAEQARSTAGAPAQGFGNQQDAYEAYLQGTNPNALRIYEEATEARREAANLATIQRTIFETLNKATRPSQIVGPVVDEFPALKDVSTDLYKFAYDHYEEYADRPYFKSIYAPDPDAVQAGNNPSGNGERKPMDARILYHIAKDFAVSQALEKGRRDESQRRSATGGGLPPARRGAPPADGTGGASAWEQLTAGEQRAISTVLQQNVTPQGWPEVQDMTRRRAAFAKHLLGRRRE